MATKIPILRQIAWLSLIPQLFFLVCIITLSKHIGFRDCVTAGVIIYLVIFFMLRFGIPIYHRKGVALYKKGLFKDAIPYFEKSYEFFKKNKWIDRYRYITLLSSSSASYTEMALLNIAFCYGQDGDGGKSIEYYKKTLSEFPKSELAKASLRMYESVKNVTEPGVSH